MAALLMAVMPRRPAPVLAGCLLAAALVSCGGGSGATVVVNAEVYTLDADRPGAEAFAYGVDGQITAVGAEREVRAKAGEDAKLIDARGNMVLPGFQDTHVHVPEAGINRDLCFIESGHTTARPSTGACWSRSTSWRRTGSRASVTRAGSGARATRRPGSAP